MRHTALRCAGILLYIRPDRFSWSADRSTDDGKTWVR